MKKLGFSLLFFVSVNAFAATQTFKVTDNNPNNYGEESIQIKTTKGNLAIYSGSLDNSKSKLLTSLKKGDCVTLVTPYKIEKYENYYSIDEVTSVKKVVCPK